MPLYDYRCTVCGEETEVYRSISAEATAPQHCGRDMEQFHAKAPHGSVQMEARYRCPATGEGVTSWKQRREIMRRHNLVDLSDAPAAKQREREAKKWAEIRRLANAPVNELPKGYKAEDFLPAV